MKIARLDAGASDFPRLLDALLVFSACAGAGCLGSGLLAGCALYFLALVFVGPRTMWGLIGIVPLATALVGFCPLYRLVGLSTCPVGGAGKQGA